MLILWGSIWVTASFAQQLKGTVKDENGRPIDAMIFVDGTNIKTQTTSNGTFEIEKVKIGNYKVVAFAPGLETNFEEVTFTEDSQHELNFILREMVTELSEITVEDKRDEELGIGWLESVSGAAIYEAKKTELIKVDRLIANTAANVGRQVYSRVPGLNIWENDGAGINLGIGGRGLNPNRTSNFNVRQNGYDISADALGYPESYYTPPVQALETIEIVRGAAGLQYGTQFGGMLNFQFKEGPKDKKIELNSTNTYGSFGLFNSFNSLGGTVGKLNYYSFYQYKTSKGWRPNSQQEQHMAFGSATYSFTPFLDVKVEQTYMTYLAQQPGGLTDFEFYQDPGQSKRERNWFDVGWSLTAMEWNYRVNTRLKFNNRTFLLSANRYAVGNLGRIDRPDDMESTRNLLKDEYHNWGNEFRSILHYTLFGQKSVLLIGNRLYFGKTFREQGTGTADSGPDFNFATADGVADDSEFTFPSKNVAFFAENIFNLAPKLSLTPGIRYEYISTDAKGFYHDRSEDLAGNVIYDSLIREDKKKPRSFALLGLGASYKHGSLLEVYSNFSQNFRAINFNDIRVDNPSLEVDENIGDERGYNIDLGIRGAEEGVFRYDVSLFYLSYRNRIGNILRTEPDPRFNYLLDRTFRYRTNIADAGIFGVEIFVEGELLRLIGKKEIKNHSLKGFLNFAAIRSEYLNNDETGIEGNQVELVPPVNIKSGLTYKWNDLGISALYSFVRQHFSDASNADSTPPVPTAVEGIIPSYFVVDLSASYKFNFIKFEAGINNLTNEYYFTRRAAGYPGPGIIPANPRNYYVGIGVRF